MANKSRKIEFNVENFYKAMRKAGFLSIQDMCNEYYKDTIMIRYYDQDTKEIRRETMNRKTLTRALKDGKMSVRTLKFFAVLFSCTEEFLMGKPEPEEVKFYDDNNYPDEYCIVYFTHDNEQALVKGKRLYWIQNKDDEGRNNYEFWAYKKGEVDDEIKVAEFCTACVMGIIRVSPEDVK